ncbi:c-type cytochrome [Ensifer aridi]|uniref:c-type cytochrome n=1 Tax=Ensifer aridi TaxID=1708715 RepID=UPI00111C3009
MKAQILASASIVFAICSGRALAEGDAVRGKQLFNRCAACHSTEARTSRDPL